MRGSCGSACHFGGRSGESRESRPSSTTDTARCHHVGDFGCRVEGDGYRGRPASDGFRRSDGERTRCGHQLGRLLHRVEGQMEGCRHRGPEHTQDLLPTGSEGTRASHRHRGQLLRQPVVNCSRCPSHRNPWAKGDLGTDPLGGALRQGLGMVPTRNRVLNPVVI